MKILYITEMWSALAEVLLHGAKDIKGMPAFFVVLKKLIEDGNEVAMLIRETKREEHSISFELQIEWLKKIHYIRVFTPEYSKIKKPVGEFLGAYQIYKMTKKELQDKEYDFVYGHGHFSEAAGVAAKQCKLPFGQRRYGDTYYSYIMQYGKLKAFCSSPVNYWSYRRKKTFMIATNDGSKVDMAYRLINKRREPYPFYFWFNGYVPCNIQNEEMPDLLAKPYLLYVARIVGWKQQELSIQLLSELKKKGITVSLLLAGQKDDETYFQSLIDLAESLGVTEQVHYIGTISREKVALYSAHALACLSFYTPCNLGNVLIEYLTSGGIVISLDDGSLDDVICSDKNGYLVHNMDEAASVVERLFHDTELQKQIRNHAFASVRDVFDTWEERGMREIKLIQESAGIRR